MPVHADMMPRRRPERYGRRIAPLTRLRMTQRFPSYTTSTWNGARQTAHVRGWGPPLIRNGTAEPHAGQRARPGAPGITFP
jgi:hypothetical protein